MIAHLKPTVAGLLLLAGCASPTPPPAPMTTAEKCLYVAQHRRCPDCGTDVSKGCGHIAPALPDMPGGWGERPPGGRGKRP